MQAATGTQRDIVVVERTPLAPGAPYPCASCVVRGATSSRLIRPEGFDLWAIEAVVEPGTELRWTDEHGDEALYVLAGSMQAGATAAHSNSAVIVESDATIVVRALERTHLVHFGSQRRDARTDGAQGRISGAPDGVHVVAEADCESLRSTGTSYYADSSCQTCSVTLLRNRRAVPHRSPSHAHSADELIYVLDGDVHIGRSSLEAGMAVAIPAHRRYAFRSQAGFDFLNHRAEASFYTGAPGDTPLLESVDAMRAAGL